MASKLVKYSVEVVLVLEITACPLADKNRESKNNFQDKAFYLVY